MRSQTNFLPAGIAPPPAKPQFALEVAVVGNRILGPRAAQVEAVCSVIWDTLSNQLKYVLNQEFDLPVIGDAHHGHKEEQTLAHRRHVNEFFDTTRQPLLTLMSALAKGVDQIAASTFLKRKAMRAGETHDIDMELDSIMPFRLADYPGLPGQLRREFDPEEAKLLLEIESTEARQVIRLDGNYANERRRLKAYSNAVSLMMDNSDLLIAVFDPLANGGPAGTQETVRRALEAEMPVLAVLLPPSQDEPLFVIWESLADRDATLDSLTASSTSWPANPDWQEDLLQLLCYLLMPPHTQPEADEQPSDTHLRTKLLTQCVQRLDMFYGNPQQTLPLAISSPIMNLFLTSTVWSGLIGLGKRNAFEHGFLLGHNLEQRPEPRSGEFGIHPYQAISKRADSLTSAMMRLYRAAFVLSFGGAALAVLSSVALLAWVAITAWEQGHPPLGALLAIGGGEILIIALLLRLEHIAHLERWQEHGVDFRFLAELVRPMPWLAQLGASTPLVSLPTFYRPLDSRQGWEAWIMRAYARTVPSLDIAPALTGHNVTPPEQEPMKSYQMTNRATCDALRHASECWIEDQRAWHHKNAPKMHYIENGLEGIAKALLWTVLLCASIALAFKIWMYYDHHVHDGFRVAAIVLGAIAASLPAAIAALNGIMFQSEARRLELRYESMFHALSEHGRSIRVRIERITLGTGDDDSSGQAWDASEALRNVAELTIAEAGEWKALYQMHHVRAG